jgi:hypothetical protein
MGVYVFRSLSGRADNMLSLPGRASTYSSAAGSHRDWSGDMPGAGRTGDQGPR